MHNETITIDHKTPQTPRTGQISTWVAGRYELLYRVGRGGMGEVYAAHDVELDRRVAIKVLHGASTKGGDDRLQREGRAIARLDHPHVVRVYDVIRADKDLFIAMEFVDGHTLADWLAAKERSWRDVLKVFRATGSALAAIHEAALVHRDFKPSNVMLTASGDAKVLDFGIALFAEEPTDLEPEKAHGISVDGSSLERFGTPAYLAPERFLDRPADHRSDQFSFCVALWEAVTGEHPFKHAEQTTRPVEHLFQGPVEAWPRKLPSWLGHVLRRGLQPRPEDRFPSMDELLTALDQGANRRRRTLMTAAALMLLAGGGLAGHIVSRNEPAILCDAAGQLTGVWDRARKDQIRTTVFATEAPGAAETWDRVEHTLDRYAEGWLTMKREACEATHLRGEQSMEVLDLRMLCLDRRRTELRVLGDVLTAADRRGVAEAAARADGLTDLSSCRASRELTDLTPLPRDPDLRQRIEQASAAIEEQRVNIQLGRAVDLETARQLVETARALEYPPVVARALDLSMRLFTEQGDAQSAVRAAEDALSAALRAGDRLLQARLHGFLVELHGYHLGDFTRAHWWRQFAEASIAALGERHPEIEYDFQLSLSRLATLKRDDAEAATRSRRALEIAERSWGPQDPRLAPPLNNLGLALCTVEESRNEGLTYLKRSIAIREAQSGSWNPHLAPSLVNLAATLAMMGRYEEALELARRGRSLLVAYYPDGGPDRAIPEIVAAQILTVVDRPQEALDNLERAVPAIVETFGEQHVFVIDALVARHDALLLQHDIATAGLDLDRAETIAEQLPPIHPLRLNVLEARGRWWLAQERYETARESFAGALEQAEALETPPGLGRLAVLCGLGEADLALGRKESARSILEQAANLVEPGLLPLTTARIRFALARALPPAERARAHDLATAALQDLTGRSLWSEERRREIEAWLGGDEPHEVSS